MKNIDLRGKNEDYVRCMVAWDLQAAGAAQNNAFPAPVPLLSKVFALQIHQPFED